MRTSVSTSSSVAALVALSLARSAPAQPCCGGSAALTPGRLEPHEDALVGLTVRGREIVGAWDASRAFVASAKGTAEVDLEQDLVGTVRLARRIEVGALVPLLETWRRSPGVVGASGGLGDLDFSARWDAVRDGDSRFPGLALLGGLAVPTGRAPESAKAVLGTDATGTGAFQISLGLAAEKTFDAWIVQLTGSGTWSSPRTVLGVSSQRSIALTTLAAVGYVVGHGAAIGAHAQYSADFGTSYGGSTAPDSVRATTKLGVTASMTLRTAWRVQTVAQSDLPLAALGKNEPAGFGVSLGTARTF